MNTLGVVHDLLYDARHAFRTCRMNRGFSAAAILTLAIGIGANTAIFSLVNAVLIRPLPYPQPESLVGVFNSGVIQGEVINDLALGPGMYAALTQGSAVFEQFGVWSAGSAAVTGSGDPEQISTIMMTQGYYRRWARSRYSAAALLSRTTGPERPRPSSFRTPIGSGDSAAIQSPRPNGCN